MIWVQDVVVHLHYVKYTCWKQKLSIDQTAIGTTGSTSTIIAFEGLGFSAHALSQELHMVA